MPLFREARYLLTEEADIRDPAGYHAVLNAIATGHNTRGGIANHIGRTSPDIGHPLSVLEDTQLITRDTDPFRRGRAGTVNDPGNQTQIQVDVAVLAPEDLQRPRRVLSLGEAKWGRTMTLKDVERLRRAQDLLEVKGFDVSATTLACYSGKGFDANLRQLADQNERVLLVGLDDLYS